MTTLADPAERRRMLRGGARHGARPARVQHLVREAELRGALRAAAQARDATRDQREGREHEHEPRDVRPPDSLQHASPSPRRGSIRPRNRGKSPTER